METRLTGIALYTRCQPKLPTSCPAWVPLVAQARAQSRFESAAGLFCFQDSGTGLNLPLLLSCMARQRVTSGVGGGIVRYTRLYSNLTWMDLGLCRQLMHNLLPFLRGLSVLSDVRPTLAESFNVPEYFSRHGYCLYEDASGFLTAAATIIS